MDELAKAIADGAPVFADGPIHKPMYGNRGGARNLPEMPTMATPKLGTLLLRADRGQDIGSSELRDAFAEYATTMRAKYYALDGKLAKCEPLRWEIVADDGCVVARFDTHYESYAAHLLDYLDPDGDESQETYEIRDRDTLKEVDGG